jgi:uncharacterized protein DUF6636
MRIAATTVLILAAAVAAVAAGPASGAVRSGYFKTADGSIWCAWSYSGSKGLGVCGIRNGRLKPRPKNRCKRVGVDYVGNRITFATTGRPRVQACAGDAGPFADPKATKVLKPGKTWKGAGISCTARRSSITCRNKSDKRFFISRRSYRIS